MEHPESRSPVTDVHQAPSPSKQQPTPSGPHCTTSPPSSEEQQENDDQDAHSARKKSTLIKDQLEEIRAQIQDHSPREWQIIQAAGDRIVLDYAAALRACPSSEVFLELVASTMGRKGRRSHWSIETTVRGLHEVQRKGAQWRRLHHSFSPTQLNELRLQKFDSAEKLKLVADLSDFVASTGVFLELLKEQPAYQRGEPMTAETLFRVGVGFDKIEQRYHIARHDWTEEEVLELEEQGLGWEAATDWNTEAPIEDDELF